jgi:selenocysteine-specific elongation factor
LRYGTSQALSSDSAAPPAPLATVMARAWRHSKYCWTASSPPDRADLEAELSISSELVDALLAQGRLVEVAAGLVYDRQTLDGLVERIRADLQAHGARTVAQLRDVLAASRKYILPLLAYTDEHKITRRVGDERVLY